MYVVLLILLVSRNVQSDRQAYFEDMIKTMSSRAIEYDFQTDFKMFESKDSTITDFGIYDFIIIGAGSTGSVIANRLSEVRDWEILLLEAGDDPDDFAMIPRYFALNVMTDYNWGYQTVPQTRSCLGNVNRVCRLPQGKGTGGTSLLSELVYSRGDPQLYNKWANIVNDSNWSFWNILPYFKKSEKYSGLKGPMIDEQYHGYDGYLHVTNFENFYPLSKVFLVGNDELGVKYTDYNGKQQLGATLLQINTKNGKRQDHYSAYIKPILQQRDNLKVSKQSFVTKIEFNVTRDATGVIFSKNRKLYRARVNFEVILSAGAIATAHLLMLSGIGPRKHLEEHGLEVIQDLEVGSTLRDHLMTQILFTSNLTTPMSQSANKDIHDYISGHGILTAANPIDVIATYNTTARTPGYPDLQISISGDAPSATSKKMLNWNEDMWNNTYGNSKIKGSGIFTLIALLLDSRSEGTVRLKSSSPYDHPLIDGNYLNDPKGLDIETLFRGILFALKLSRTSAFQSINATLAIPPNIPGCRFLPYLSKQFWYCFIRHASQSAYHPVGTCPMGSVVDPHFKVYGVRKLRVADSSVFPFTLTGQPNAVCAMIGEKLGDIIKKDYGQL